jgi:hypothetical protein
VFIIRENTARLLLQILTDCTVWPEPIWYLVLTLKMWISRQLVGPLGRVICPLEGLCLRRVSWRRIMLTSMLRAVFKPRSVNLSSVFSYRLYFGCLYYGHWSVECRYLSTVYITAGIAQWYTTGLGAGWSGVRVPAGAGNFSLHHCVQTGSGARPASYPMGTRGSFPGDKAAEAWSWPLNYF